MNYSGSGHALIDIMRGKEASNGLLNWESRTDTGVGVVVKDQWLALNRRSRQN